MSYDEKRSCAVPIPAVAELAHRSAALRRLTDLWLIPREDVESASGMAGRSRLEARSSHSHALACVSSDAPRLLCPTTSPHTDNRPPVLHSASPLARSGTSCQAKPTSGQPARRISEVARDDSRRASSPHPFPKPPSATDQQCSRLARLQQQCRTGGEAAAKVWLCTLGAMEQRRQLQTSTYR